jgi:hypothetical protein
MPLDEFWEQIKNVLESSPGPGILDALLVDMFVPIVEE